MQKHGAVAYAALDEPLLLAKGTVPWGVPATPALAATPAGPTRPRRRPAPLTGMPVPESVAARDDADTDRRDAATAAARPACRAFAATPPPAGYAPCSDCAVVEIDPPVEVAPRGGVIGAIGGAIAGAILGKKLGEAHKPRMLALWRDRRRLAGRQIEATGDAVHRSTTSTCAWPTARC